MDSYVSPGASRQPMRRDGMFVPNTFNVKSPLPACTDVGESCVIVTVCAAATPVRISMAVNRPANLQIDVGYSSAIPVNIVLSIVPNVSQIICLD